MNIANIPDQTTPPLTHLAVIMDGNGRWATARNLPRTAGHRAGVERAQEIVQNCLNFGITHLSLYTFSHENWKRPSSEITFLFDLLVTFINKELHSLAQNGVKLTVIGQEKKIPLPARHALKAAMRKTAGNSRLFLNLAINYSGRQEIVDACKAYFQAHGSVNNLNPESLTTYLYTAGQPDPDLLIRTSGEMRLSGFLPFQTTYSELYFTPVLWPDFDTKELLTALEHFAQRQRRYGAIRQENALV